MYEQNEEVSRPRRVRTTIGALAAVVAGLVGGTLVADATMPGTDAPAGVASTPDGEPAPALEVSYPVNAAGQTYGAGDNAVAPDDWPDLLLAEATNGQAGYVNRAVLDKLTGANVSSPEEALAWQLKTESAKWDQIYIAVYLSDGQTEVGSFPISRSQLIEP